MFILFYLAITIALGLCVFCWRRKRLGNIALLFFSLSLCFTGLEAYYRFLYAESDGFGRLSRNFAKRYYRSDEWGLRASNLPLSETKANLVVVGDSHVFGAGLKSPAQRFSEKLAARYPQFHVINLGFSGWDTRRETTQLQKYLGDSNARISLVALAYFFNDIEEDVLPADRERLPPPRPPVKPTWIDRALQWVSNYSRFVELFYYRIGYPRLVRDRLEQIQLFYQDPVVRQRHLESLEEFRSVVEKKYSARLLVVMLPFLHSEQMLQQTELYQNFRQALESRGFQCLDLQPLFASYRTRQLVVNRFDPHPNAFANQLIADAIVSYLEARPNYLGQHHAAGDALIAELAIDNQTAKQRHGRRNARDPTGDDAAAMDRALPGETRF